MGKDDKNKDKKKDKTPKKKKKVKFSFQKPLTPDRHFTIPHEIFYGKKKKGRYVKKPIVDKKYLEKNIQVKFTVELFEPIPLEVEELEEEIPVEAKA